MTIRVLSRRLGAAAHWVRSAVHEWTGAAEYERYRRGCTTRGQVPCDRGRYYADRVEEKYRTSTGCC